MSNTLGKVGGIPLTNFEGPIITALETYTGLSNGMVEFELGKASVLEHVIGKPNTARSATSVRYSGKEKAASLHVIAFAPGDSTGNPTTERTRISGYKEFPAGAAIAPRSKSDFSAEAHLTIASAVIEEPNQDPFQFAGSLGLFGIEGDRIAEVGVLGQQCRQFARIILANETTPPTATLTTGYRSNGERIADPHAVFNGWDSITQVCAFVAIDANAPGEYLNIMNLLNAAEPRPAEQSPSTS